MIRSFLFFVLALGILTAQVPVVTQAGVVNGGDNTPNFSPGTIVSVYGQNLATRVTQAAAVPLPTELDGVCVDILQNLVSTGCAPLYFVSPGQVNAQLPYSVTGSGVSLRVRTAQGVSATIPITVVPRAPRLLTRSMDGRGDALLLHADYSLVTANSGARPGEYLILYLIGLGAVNPQIDAGRPGGDGGKGGPLNVVTETASVLINGTEVTAAWAGVAPYYPGLYQINFQAPANLPVGAVPLQVKIGAGISQTQVVSYGALVAAEPADVVRRLLESQAAGDVSGVLSLWNTEGQTEAVQKISRDRIEIVRRAASFSNLRYEPLATVRGDKGTIAVVRGYVNATVVTKDGVRTLRNGLLAVLRKVQGTWKVAGLGPDDLLNMEIASDTVVTSAVKQASSGQANLIAINLKLNDLMNHSYIDEQKAARAATFAAIGAKGGTFGDGIANVYQVGDTVVNFGGVLSELWQYGPFSQILLVKHTQVGVGIAQIVTEVVPGVDAATDALAASMDQLVYNLEIQRGFQELKATLGGLGSGDLLIHPRLFPLLNSEWDDPGGVEFSPAIGVQHSFGVALGGIDLIAPTVLGKALLLQVIGEVPIPSSLPAFQVAEKLGATLRDGVYYLPVDIGHMVEAETLSNDSILEGWSKRRNASSTGKWMVWDMTCRRGVQQIAVRLRTGETTPAVTVRNKYMNSVQSFAIVGGPNTEPFPIGVGSSLQGLKVLGVGPGLTGVFQPDLTSLGQCLDMAVLDSTVATLERGATVTLRGVKTGQTVWRLLLGGSAYEPGVRDVTRDIRLEVAQSTVVPLLNQTTKFGHNVYGIVTYSATDVGPNLIGPFFALPGLTWNGATFSATAQDSALVNAGDPPFAVTLNGTVSPDGLKILNAHYKRYRLVNKNTDGGGGRLWKTYDENLNEWDLGPIDLAVPPRGFAGTTSFRYEALGAAAGAAIRNFVCVRKTYDGWVSDFDASKLQTRNCTVAFPAENRYYINIDFIHP